MMYPYVHEIPYCDAHLVFDLWADEPFSLFLDSSKTMGHCGRYSFIAVEPFKTYLFNDSDNPFERLSVILDEYKLSALSDLPPFQGGAAGFFGYELNECLEKLPEKPNPDNWPNAALGLYDCVIAFDHQRQTAYIFSTGFPEKEKAKRSRRAKARIDMILEKINRLNSVSVHITSSEIESTVSKSMYCQSVNMVRKYIEEGDVFEVNISQEFKARCDHRPYDIYQSLRIKSPAPFAGFFNVPGCTIASASPERFLRLHQGVVEACPIKGTRPRGNSRKKDESLALELQQSEKDRSENVMIVDLMRNDFAKVCEPASIEVTELCVLYSFESVHHLISTIVGKLANEYSSVDLLRATFPAGSITGAPKVRAMEIISELEPHRRGPYCGSMGYISFAGDLDMSVLIRTMVFDQAGVRYCSGGAIVYASDSDAEYEETVVKVMGFKSLIGGVEG